MTRTILVVALALAGCGTALETPPRSPTIGRIDAAYQRLRGPIKMAIARMPKLAASRARAGVMFADAALEVVRSEAAPVARFAAARDLVRVAAVLTSP